MSNSTLDGALAMAGLGFRVFPCEPNAKRPTCHWQQEGTTNPDTIRAWFAAIPNMNYGVAMDDKHFALDLDCKGERNGQRDLASLEQQHSDLPNTLIVKTPSGGFHLFFVGHAANSVGKKSLGGGIDVRGDGGYVVGPGSIIDGARYEIANEAAIADAPDWVLALTARQIVEPAKRAEGVADDSPHEISRMRAYLRNRVEQGDVAIEFQGGNSRTFAIACEVMDRVNEKIAFDLLAKEWNPFCDPPWSEGELRVIVGNAARYRQNEIAAKASKPPEEAFVGYGQQARRDQAKAGNFKGMTYQNAAETKTRRIEWLWRPRIPAGMLSILGGDPDCGKSTIMYSIGATITKGGVLPLGEGTVDIGRVLVLAGEESKDRVSVPRLKAAGADLRYVTFVDPLIREDDTEPRLIDLAQDLDRIKGVIAALEADGGPKVKLLIIDPLSAYLGATANAYKASDMRRLLTPISDWADKEQIAVIVVAHLNKSSASTTALNRLSDSHAIGALSRAAWLTAPERDEDGKETRYFLMMRGKNNLTSRDTPNLRYRIEGVDVPLDDGSVYNHPRVVWVDHASTTADEAFSQDYSKPRNKGEAAEAFLKGTLADGPVPVAKLKEMAEERGIGWRTVEAAKAKLSVRSKQIGTPRSGGYTVWHLRDEAEEAASLYAADVIDPSDPDFAILGAGKCSH